MVPLLRKPILIGGLGLTASAWLLDSFHSSLTDFSGTIVWGSIALGAGLWWFNHKRQPAPLVLTSFTPVDRTATEAALATVEGRMNQLAAELVSTDPESTSAPECLLRLRQQWTDLTAELDRKDIRFAVMGNRAAGKTTLIQLLAQNSSAQGAFPPSALSESVVPSEVENADLILFLTTGDLTDSELQTLKQLIAKNHRILVLFNKQDQYLPTDRPVILQQIRDRLSGLLAAVDVLPIAAQPASVKVRQHQEDGTTIERFEQPEPEIAGLQARIQQILTDEAQSLIYATVKRQAEALTIAVQQELNQARRQRALPILEQYQWIAGAAAFANPLPTLDLVATATINAQMVVDLGAIYQQSFSLEQARTVMGNLASQMVKLGLVEMASQAIAPLLKSHALTYVAGGTVQGLSAAYLTRIAGLSLVEYFEEQSLSPASTNSLKIDRLVQKLKIVFESNQRSAFLQGLVKQGIGRLLPTSANAATVG
jgi:uncharacterized protein